VAQNQRERMLRALAEAMAEHGYVATSVADVIRRAGTSRETFYQQFSSKQDCFIAAYEEAAAKVLAGVGRAAGHEGTPLERFDHAVSAYLEALAAEPAFARLFLLEVYAAGPAALNERFKLQRRFVDLMAERLQAEGPTEHFACETLVAGVSAMVTARLAEGDVEGLQTLREPLIDLVTRALAHRAGR